MALFKSKKPKTPEKPTEQELVSEVKEFVERAEGASSEERRLVNSDLNFVYDEGGQWDEATLKKRPDRPSYTFNHVLAPVNQVLGEQRMFRASIKLRGVDSDTDPDLAEIMSGLIRNIEAISDAESAYDMAFKYAVAGGFGAWRIVTEFQNDFSFDQEVFVKPIYNPMTVFFDPLAFDPVKRDQNQCVIAERVSKDAHEAKYGEAGAEFESSRDDQGWVDEEGFRVAEYFKRVPFEKEIALMSDGRVVPFDEDLKKIEAELTGEAETATILRRRKVKTFQIVWWKVDGSRILEGPITYDWKHIPVVKLPGRYINIEGKQKTQSLIRPARDPQMVYNYDRTTMSETTANAPRQPYHLTEDNIQGHEDEWASSGSRNAPYLIHKFDPNSPLTPRREAAAEVPQALIALAAHDANDIKMATGFHDASLGRQGTEVSGEAIERRQRVADIGSFEFFDNFKKAMRFTGDILVDIIPTVYDTERTIRIIGLDGQEDFQKINAYDEATDEQHDLSRGRFDVRVDIGPGFSTQREEAFATIIQAAEKIPIIAEVGADLIIRSMPGPDADELSKRVRKRLIGQGVVEPTDEEREEIAPPAPDPVSDALVDSEAASAELDRAKTGKTQAETAEIVATLPSTVKAAEVDVITKGVETLRGK